MTLRCATCDEEHDALPDLGLHAPDPYLDVPEEERAARTTFTLDRCTVRDAEDTHYFLRGVLLIPIHAQRDPFGLGVWVSQSQANFERYLRNEEMEPTFGWLVNQLAHYPESTFLLKTRVRFRVGDQRPTIDRARNGLSRACSTASSQLPDAALHFASSSTTACYSPSPSFATPWCWRSHPSAPPSAGTSRTSASFLSSVARGSRAFAPPAPTRAASSAS